MADALRKSVIELDWKINGSSLQKANEETDRLIAKSGQMQQAFNQGASAINSTTNSISKYGNTAQQGTNNVVQMGAKTQSAFRGTNSAVQASTNNVVQFGSRGTSAFSSVGSSATSAKSNVVSMTSALNTASNTAGSLGTKMKSSITSAKNNVIDLSSKFGGLSNSVTGATGKIAQSIETSVNKPLNVAKGLLGGLLATAGVAGAGSLFNAGIDRLSAIEDAKLSLDVMMGDSGKAQAFMDQILDFAKTTPYAFTQLSSSAKNLFAYGMEQQNIVPTLKAIGDLAAASGKGAGAIDTLSNAFGKMQVMGKVSTEQLNTITEAGVPALKILANEAGTTVEEMQKQISSGSIESGKAIATIVKGIQEGSAGIAGETQALGGVMEKLKGTWKGSLDSMKSAVTGTMATLMTPAKPHIQAGMAWFATQFKKLPDIVNSTGKFLEPAWAPTKKAFSNMQNFFSNTFVPSVKEVGRELGPHFLKAGVASINFFSDTITTYAKPVLVGAKDFIVKDFIPTVAELGKTMGPSFIDGGISALKSFGWAVDNVVKPPLKWLKEYSEEHPERMQKMAKFAGIGVGGLLLFNKVGKPIMGATGKVFGLIGAIKKIGSTSIAEATKSKLAFQTIGNSAQSATQSVNAGSLVDDAGNLIAQRSKVKTPSKLAGGLKWFTSGNVGAEKAFVPVAKHAGKATMGAKAVGAVSKVGGAVKGVGKSIPGIAYVAAATNLIGTNKNNVGDKLGGSGGMLAGGAVGAKLGGLIGTAIAPGIGTAIGGAVGGIAGTLAGSKFGQAMGKSIQKNWPAISKTMGKMWEGAKNNIFIGPLVSGIDSAAKQAISIGKKSVKATQDFFAKPFDTKVKSSKDVSKDSAKKVNSYMANQEKVIESQVKLKITGKPMTDAEFQDVMKTYDAMESQVTKSLNAKKDKSSKNMDKLLSLGALDQSTVDSAKRSQEELAKIRVEKYKKGNQDLKSLLEKQRQEEVEVTQKYEKRNSDIRERASKERRELNKKELDEIKRNEWLNESELRGIRERYGKEQKELNSEQTKNAVGALSESAKEQKIILGNLKDATGEISAKQAANIVSQSYKAKEGSINAAREKYDETKKILDEEYYVTGSISKAEYEEAVKNAKQTRDESIATAEETHNGVVEQAQKQAEGHLDSVDWETGQTLSKWDNFKVGLSKAVNLVTGGISSVLEFFGLPRIPKWEPKGSSNSSAKSGSNKIPNKYKGDMTSYQGPAFVGEEGIELAYDKSRSETRILGSNGPEMTHVRSSERILNHKDTMAVLNGGMGAGSVLPGFAEGKGNGLTDLVDGAKDFGAKAWDKAKDVGGKVVSGVKAGVETAKAWLGDPIGQVKALVDKHNPFKKQNNTITDIGFGTMNKIKTSGADWVKNKLSEFKDFFASEEGASFGAGAYAPHFGAPFQRTSPYGPRPGLFGDFHTGIDYAAPTGTPLPAQFPGTVTYSGGATGYGNLIKIQVAKGIETLYGHMKSVSTKTGDTVKSGEIIGAVGSEGWSTGPHVHYELQANGKHVNPDTYGQTGASVGSGGWEPQVRKAAKQMGQTASDAEVNGILAQIQRESSGNQSIVQSSAVWDVNTASGNPARGLLQYIPQTFDAYKLRGYENIMNGFHQLLAFFNNSNWRIDLPYGRSGWGPSGHRIKAYAKGGRPTKGETVLVGENGPELFETDTAGTVHPHEKTKSLFAQGAPQINFSPTVNVEIKGNAEPSVAGSIKDAVRQVLDEEYSKLLNIFGTGGVV
ncbi:peptidoglycan DD-metalloendopeptidase family protein [Enterococcus wangshanyuanii]|uniref:Peptidase M23 n=1 Tax=Enterococcus wangshanyuanii TaxID=2005703 RepID=A0ABQ1PIP9_9ENTE|nr:peptidoglycan DD-metalloendopeptidase family protein [Enterococcus wangshanyuanii]GGC97990.1 peptidase M23 [Enterococcus wangshanyuanii]